MAPVLRTEKYNQQANVSLLVAYLDYSSTLRWEKNVPIYTLSYPGKIIFYMV
jgi:hypothetical protein